MENITIRPLYTSEIHPELLLPFRHDQHITQKWVKANGTWELTDADELRQWDAEKRKWIAEYLCEQINSGGGAICAFVGSQLVGFCSVGGKLCNQYANLTMLFVDDDWKRRGIGKKLFAAACGHAIEMGADKLFISSIPSMETVAFYQALGCVDAMEIIEEFVDTPYDRYMESELTSRA